MRRAATTIRLRQCSLRRDRGRLAGRWFRRDMVRLQPLSLLILASGNLPTTLNLGSKEKLNWESRFKVEVGTAKGHEYLHEGCPRRIIHRDIKAANILLTADC